MPSLISSRPSLLSLCALAALAVTILLALPHAALAQPYMESISGQGPHLYIDLAAGAGGQQLSQPPPPSGTDIYSSVGMPLADWGWSSPDANTCELGDFGNCTGRGLLHECDFTVFNGVASAAPLTSLTMTLKIYNELQASAPPGSANSVLLGTFSCNVAWPGTGLAPGFYSIVTVTNLDALAINLPAITTGASPPPARFLWTQQASNVVGATRIGFANNSTVTLGSSGQSVFIHDSTHSPVFEFLNNPQTISNPGFRVNIASCTQPYISSSPLSRAVCPTGSAMFSVAATGTPPLVYQWQIQPSPGGAWQGMGNDPGPLPCGGNAFSYASPIFSPDVTIGVRPCPGYPGASQHFQIRCVVTSSCGAATSNEATYTICPADFNCSGSLEIQDIFDFLNAWFAGAPNTDFDGANGLQVQDIFAFLNAWFAGC